MSESRWREYHDKRLEQACKEIADARKDAEFYRGEMERMNGEWVQLVLQPCPECDRRIQDIKGLKHAKG